MWMFNLRLTRNSVHFFWALHCVWDLCIFQSVWFAFWKQLNWRKLTLCTRNIQWGQSQTNLKILMPAERGMLKCTWSSGKWSRSAQNWRVTETFLPCWMNVASNFAGFLEHTTQIARSHILHFDEADLPCWSVFDHAAWTLAVFESWIRRSVHVMSVDQDNVMWLLTTSDPSCVKLGPHHSSIWLAQTTCSPVFSACCLSFLLWPQWRWHNNILVLFRFVKTFHSFEAKVMSLSADRCISLARNSWVMWKIALWRLLCSFLEFAMTTWTPWKVQGPKDRFNGRRTHALLQPLICRRTCVKNMLNPCVYW